MAAQHFATAGYFAPGRDISMADHMLDVVIRSEGAEVAELVDLYQDSQVHAADRALMHDLASSRNSDTRCDFCLPSFVLLRILLESDCNSCQLFLIFHWHALCCYKLA